MWHDIIPQWRYSILNTGIIRLAATPLRSWEHPVARFYPDPIWENTVVKGVASFSRLSAHWGLARWGRSCYFPLVNRRVVRTLGHDCDKDAWVIHAHLWVGDGSLTPEPLPPCAPIWVGERWGLYQGGSWQRGNTLSYPESRINPPESEAGVQELRSMRTVGRRKEVTKNELFSGF